MKKINIDFTEAALISNEMESLVSKTTNILKSSSLVEGLQSKYFANTINLYSNIVGKINKISNDISTLQSGFDRSVQAYYETETNSTSVSVSSSTNQPATETGSFSWGYKSEASSISKIGSDDIISLLNRRGTTKVGDKYQITIKGKTYYYNPETGMMTSPDNKKFYCCFYATNNSKETMEFNNSITILATGKGGTHISSNTINPNYDLISDNSLIITPYTVTKNKNTGKTENMGAGNVAASTMLGDYIFGLSDDSTRSIVGFSAGSAVTTRTVASNPGLYDNVAYVNGSTHTMTGGEVLKNSNYSAFKNTKVYYLETERGWCETKASTRESIKGTINSINTLIKNGVPAKNITLVTNDKTLASSANKKINIDTSMPSSCSDGKLYGHTPWRVFNNSGILSYLSNI